MATTTPRNWGMTPEEIKTRGLERVVKDYMWAGLVDQNPEYFNCGDVNRTAMAEDSIDEFDLDDSPEAPVWDWAHEMAVQWEGTGTGYMSDSELEELEPVQTMSGYDPLPDLRDYVPTQETIDFWEQVEHWQHR